MDSWAQPGPGLDWSAPWWADWRAQGHPLEAAARAGQPWPQALNQGGQAPVRFVPQAELPAGSAYESHIFATACVPTRPGWHDFFNALCWMRFPASKRQLNRLQAAAIQAAGGVQAQRGPLRDAVTLFDENAALLQAPDPLWAALLARDWQRLFVGLRPLWAQARLVLFGHALLEKLVQPYTAITAHVWRVPVPLGLPADPAAGPHGWDGWLQQQLGADALARKPFTPLPVLGTPGWWPANQEPAFYQDATVFRPPRAPMPRP
jgi:hypothetical protein